MTPQEFREIAKSLNNCADEMERQNQPAELVRQLRESAQIAERHAMENVA